MRFGQSWWSPSSHLTTLWGTTIRGHDVQGARRPGGDGFPPGRFKYRAPRRAPPGDGRGDAPMAPPPAWCSG